MKTIIAAAGLATALALGANTASAQADHLGVDVSGGSRLLDASRAAQLGRWLGAGDIKLSNVYTLRPGDTAPGFHQAADGNGATFTLLEVTNPAGRTYLVGGYNPQSWSAGGTWNETPRDYQRTAFLFNMTAPAVYRQTLSDYVLPSQGLRQTFNDLNLGPEFGSGPDLFVNNLLDGAVSWQLSYGNPAEEGLSIVDRTRRRNRARGRDGSVCDLAGARAGCGGDAAGRRRRAPRAARMRARAHTHTHVHARI
nr:PEP_CTERM-anchored TLD domain-containing protein [Massilia sp. 9096]